VSLQDRRSTSTT